MRKPIMAGNWKMNKTVEEAVEFVRSIRSALHQQKEVDTVVCPPFIAIPAVAEALSATSIKIGAQNMHYEASGAFTGELSAEMIRPYCQFVILGHSERRTYFGENNENVNRKVKAALGHGITPIICVGESLEQNEAGLTESFVGDQVKAALDGLESEEAASCIMAYEPIWAIGTGRSASPVEAGRIIGLTVRGTIADLYGEVIAQRVRIQYGGSANARNISDFMMQPDIDGALVGGASLKPEFVEMVKQSAQAMR